MFARYAARITRISLYEASVNRKMLPFDEAACNALRDDLVKELFKDPRFLIVRGGFWRRSNGAALPDQTTAR
jgi:hypothetical protein